MYYENMKVPLQDARQFYEMYYSVFEVTEEMAYLKGQYLQKYYGVIRYPTNLVYEPTKASDVIYATLGAMRDLEDDRDLTIFEISAFHIFENEGVVDYKTEQLSVDCNFTKKNYINMLSLCGMVSFLKRIGMGGLNLSFYQKLRSLIPNLKDPRASMVGHFVLAKNDKTLFGYAHKLLFNFFASRKVNLDATLTKTLRKKL